MRTAFTELQLAEPHVREADRELRKCVHCGFCTAVCPTYVLTGDERDSPRGRMALIQHMLESDAPPAPETVHHLDRCLSCLGCRTICPSTVDYAALIDTARAHIEKTYRRPWPERAFRAFLAWVLARPAAFAWFTAFARVGRPLAWLLPWNLRAMTAKVPRPRRLTRAHRTVEPPSRVASRVALLPGCVQRVLAPEIDFAARRVLARQGIHATPLGGTGCCGALAFHLGKTDEARAQARTLIAALMRPGPFDAVTITATGCAAFLKDYGRVFADDPEWSERAGHFAARVRDFSELAAPAEPARAPAMTVAYQPPCSLQFGQRIEGRGEMLLAAAGYALAPVADAHLCCGSAGSYSMTQPAMSSELRARKSAALAASRPQAITSGNIGCLVQLAGETPAVHIAELLDWAQGGPVPPALTGWAPSPVVRNAPPSSS
jgi:glycolate oxidase iron-sulfur subunit